MHHYLIYCDSEPQLIVLLSDSRSENRKSTATLKKSVMPARSKAGPPGRKLVEGMGDDAADVTFVRCAQTQAEFILGIRLESA
jgi:hypothetical protein